MLPLYDKKKIKDGFPLATTFLIVLNTIFFLCTISNLNHFIDLFGFTSEKLWDGRFFTILTSIFLHGNIWHLILNMWFLWVFGDNLESRLGKLKFLGFYLLCGVGGGILYALAMSDPAQAVIGASGAISGVLGGYLVLFPKNKIRTFLFFCVASIPAVIYIFVWFLLQLFSTSALDTSVSYFSHIGGFITGILFVKMFKKGR
ncbi:rhomboid family intramembrane serine protease [bacterium]|jgi:membrane associated rhomboid family serine protease|nr:rhomboid family intramembrane serine protease [bacterium]